MASRLDLRSAGLGLLDDNPVPRGRVLFIHPPYVHLSYLRDGGAFAPDPAPFLPLGPLFAGQILEQQFGAEVDYFDCQLHDLRDLEGISDYDAVAVGVMGTQNNAPAHDVYTTLTEWGVAPDRIYFGGQGVEGLLPDEFTRVYPGAKQVPRTALAVDAYWSTRVGPQIDKLPEDDLHVYFSNEMTLLTSQGCIFGCTFCGAQTQQREQFFDTANYLDDVLARAVALGYTDLAMYSTSLDFFQQALPGRELPKLVNLLETIVETSERHGVRLELRALTRADSYLAAMQSHDLLDLVRAAGYGNFGFGADGAASTSLLLALRKGSDDLRSDLLGAFEHAEANDITPEILYVFGIAEDDEATLAETKSLCSALLATFPSSVYRGFPAKNEIPGNANWRNAGWRSRKAYDALLDNPELFVNLGFECLANEVSHDDVELRRLVNKFAIEMSAVAHGHGRVQSYLTIPMASSGADLMTAESFDILIDIIERYSPGASTTITLESLVDHRDVLNRSIPKDK